MKRTCITLIMLVCALCAYAVPARNVTFTHTQKDGTVLTLRLVGDEHMHYYQNVATGQAMRKAADGDYVVIAAEELAAQQELAAARRAEVNKQRIARLPRMRQMQNDAGGPAYAVGNFNAMTGTKKGIVILVNFADVELRVGAVAGTDGNTDFTGTQAAFYNQFNQSGYSQNNHIGSVKDYFSAQSYGQFTVDFDVVGPVTVSQNMAYYGAPKEKDHDSYPASMVIEACKLADAAGVDFSKYDWNGDGLVDQVFVIYAGYNEAQGGHENTIWPHEWTLVSAQYYNQDGEGYIRLDGKIINTYACTSELSGNSGVVMDGIGTACHEFSHCLGYPDTYDTSNSGGVAMDSYDVMCSGSYNGPGQRGEVPSGYTAYERWMAGWLTPKELTSPATITDMMDLGSEGEAYIIYNSSNKNEYFLLENRQSKEWFSYFDNNTAGHGLFITHVDFDQELWRLNKVNTDVTHQRMSWVPADKDYGTYYSQYKRWRSSSVQQKGDYFPGTSNVTSFKPSATAWATTGGNWFTQENGSYYTNHELSEITENTTDGTISFLFDGGAPEPTPAALYYPHIAKLGQPFTAPAFTTDSDGAQTWTSSNPEVASVDAATGSVTIKTVGTTIITVTQSETSSFKQASASYMIKVVE